MSNRYRKITESQTPIADYVAKKNTLGQTLTVISGGKMYAIIKCERILFSKFKESLQLPERLYNVCLDNPCKKVANLL